MQKMYFVYQFQKLVITINPLRKISLVKKKYIKYIPYIPWPTPCEVAVEMQTMVSCEHLAAETRGWSAFDWAEHCLKQTRGIPEDEVCEQYTLRQWQFVSGQN